jgi:hypothetical protein
MAGYNGPEGILRICCANEGDPLILDVSQSLTPFLAFKIDFRTALMLERLNSRRPEEDNF